MRQKEKYDYGNIKKNKNYIWLPGGTLANVEYATEYVMS
jgi:hypothetical protein